ncbi:3,4-dihydroxyphenylacetate 2,3-dioxygenase [Solihabitans fulvus]|uniref:3,4-dihydroxyphenylacetate 2,3-dioxygenase n=1 Tax=Solihabitans fulvus TaxID=1892852 RepID=A0A5B2XTY5_9PSEU|nr:3,4-dihydroxyphenylacetate 2,3-dioxygenase [Solihabitans fulvus]KAA2267147.1 3,4-dihydroxyphenylacetate 2,3-dioxygenase [Solihabitans fulvus]
MGELVLAAKITHVPSIWLSVQPGRHHGIRRPAELGLAEVGRRARERGADTFLVADSHWMNSMGFHLNGKARHHGSYASHELPHFIADLVYDYPGCPELAALVGEEIDNGGQHALVHNVTDLGLEYATLVPMHFMNRDGDPLAVLPIGCNIYSTIEENRRVGEAIARAVLRSDRKVAFLASGSLSHQFPTNEISSAYLNRISNPFNEQTDRVVLEQWRDGRIAEFLATLPTYNERCTGEAAMADTAMLFGLLGWDAYTGHGEQLCEYFPSSGTGQVIVDFPVPA